MGQQPGETTAAHPPAPARTLGGFLDEAWQRISRGVADRRAAARHPVLATAGRSGGAEARMVVLRGADRGAGRLTIHTDASSGKVAELRADPRATLLIWEARAQLQMRLRVCASLRPGTEDEWARVPAGAQVVYGGDPAPGTRLSHPGEHAPGPDPARFLVVACKVEEIELLHLGQDRHYRAIFAHEDGWAGRWVAP